jgi:pimeloyl-ACP methyl ester carboxylesterase
VEFVEYQDWKFSYEKTGNGFPPLLLFHGFGQTHKVFKPLVDTLKNNYTCYSFDLFHHGESTAPKDQPLEISTWNKIFQIFLEKEELADFSVGGFSIGGKYLLPIILEHASHISQVIFIAPDGIKTNIWYKLATYPAPLRKLFRSMIRHPQRFFLISRLLRRLGFIDKRLSFFVEKQMKSPTQRLRLYETWAGIRRLKIKTRDIKHVLIKNKISTNIFLSKNDKIIPVKPFKRFCKKIPTCNLHIFNCGHYELIKKVAGYYSEKQNSSFLK